IFGWLPALLLSFLMYDFIFLVAPIWAVAVVPASMDLYRGLRWRAVECVAFSIVTVLSLGFPLT
ncbi:hypothetical protein ACSLVN_27730, partial [Klebsiella pneumoniae]|uniref:hypothetical protein n=1 Tax=Klebsiella pneumoniae TaxID=573 RepID=UPI003EDFCDD3